MGELIVILVILACTPWCWSQHGATPLGGTHR